MKGFRIVFLMTLTTAMIAVGFYYTLKHAGDYQQEAAQIMKERFLERLQTEPDVDHSRWRMTDLKGGSVTYSGSLPVNQQAWEFIVNGEILKIFVYPDLRVPTEVQSSLAGKISETASRLLNLKKEGGPEPKIEVSFPKPAN